MWRTNTSSFLNRSLILGFCICVGLNACSPESREPKDQQAKQNKTPSVSVTVSPVVQRDYPIFFNTQGVVTALNTVAIRSQVTGTIAKVHFKEGAYVKKGALLFSLDERRAQMDVAQARAQLQKDRASLVDAQRILRRNEDLVKRNFVAKSAVDTSQAQAEALLAVVAADEAALKANQVALSYTQISAPINGRAGSVDVYPGSLAQAGAADALVTLTQMDPIGISFSVPQDYLTSILAQLQQTDIQNVTVRIPNMAKTYGGRIVFVDNHVDAVTGTLKVKASFANGEHVLWPGAYADVHLQLQTMQNAHVIPLAAIITELNAQRVYVVAQDGKAQLRTIKLVQTQGEEAVVTGVEVGEHVVVNGKQNVKPGSSVKIITPSKEAQNTARAK